jgi:transposase
MVLSPPCTPDWIDVHVSLFAFLGGAPKFVVCDNLKAAVTNPDRYDPGLNRTYAEMARHYGTTVLAARPRKPKDKAKVEVAVQVAQRWILARLRNQRFFSLAELNAAIAVLVTELNARTMRSFQASRPNSSPRSTAPSSPCSRPSLTPSLEAVPCRARLSRRGRGALVFHAFPSHPRTRRCPHR